MRDTRLTRASANGLPKDGLLWRLMEPAWGHDPTEGTRGQRMLALMTYFIRDIGNGGLDQALYNFDPPEVDFVLRSLDEVGAVEHAAAVRSGLRAYFGEKPPATLEERRQIIDQHPRTWIDQHIDPLSRLLDDEGALEPYFLRYVEAHPVEFFID